MDKTFATHDTLPAPPRRLRSCWRLCVVTRVVTVASNGHDIVAKL
jgi:hypothetical protein